MQQDSIFSEDEDVCPMQSRHVSGEYCFFCTDH